MKKKVTEGRLLIEAYHVTSEDNVKQIREKGFKVGKTGRFGKGIYFFIEKSDAEGFDPGGVVLEATILNHGIAWLHYDNLKDIFSNSDVSWEEEEGVPELKEWLIARDYYGCGITYDDGTCELVVYEKTLVDLKREDHQEYERTLMTIMHNKVDIGMFTPEELTNQMKICFVLAKGENIRHFKSQTNFLCRLAIKSNWSNLRYVKRQTKELCELALEESPDALQFVKEQTEEMCLKAVKRNPCVLTHARKQTEEMCLEAIRKFPPLIVHVIDATPRICYEAVKLSPFAIASVPEQTIELCTLAVKGDGLTIRHIDNQTPELCMLAYEQNPKAEQFFRL